MPLRERITHTSPITVPETSFSDFPLYNSKSSVQMCMMSLSDVRMTGPPELLTAQDTAFLVSSSRKTTFTRSATKPGRSYPRSLSRSFESLPRTYFLSWNGGSLVSQAKIALVVPTCEAHPEVLLPDRQADPAPVMAWGPRTLVRWRMA